MGFRELPVAGGHPGHSVLCSVAVPPVLIPGPCFPGADSEQVSALCCSPRSLWGPGLVVMVSDGKRERSGLTPCAAGGDLDSCPQLACTRGPRCRGSEPLRGDSGFGIRRDFMGSSFWASGYEMYLITETTAFFQFVSVY